MNDLIDTLPAGYLSFADDGTIVLANAALLRLLGYTTGEIEGQPVELLLPPGGRIFYRSYFAPRLKLDGGLDEIYMVLCAKNGAETPVLVSAARHERAGVMMSDCVLVPIRQRSQFESELLEARRQAESATRAQVQANRELEAFAYSVSHDLRAPLRAIDGFTRILQEDYVAALPEDAQQLFEQVRSNAQQMACLIDDLLSFARLSRQPLAKQMVDHSALVQQCLNDLQAEQAGRRIEWQIGALPDSMADPALLRQVWLNLLGNALKYSRKRDPARIEVHGRSEGAATHYWVKDNGVGFDMRYSDKLFGVFQRMHRAEDYEGTGVGLAIVQRIVYRHGGRTWAEAAVDRGATFFFTLESGESSTSQV